MRRARASAWGPGSPGSPDQSQDRLPQLVNSLIFSRARHDHLIVIECERVTQLALAAHPLAAWQLVALGEGGEHTGRARSEQLLNRTVLVRRVAPDVEQPEYAGEAGTLYGMCDEQSKGAALCLGRPRVSVAGEIEDVVRRTW